MFLFLITLLTAAGPQGWLRTLEQLNFSASGPSASDKLRTPSGSTAAAVGWAACRGDGWGRAIQGKDLNQLADTPFSFQQANPACVSVCVCPSTYTPYNLTSTLPILNKKVEEFSDKWH